MAGIFRDGQLVEPLFNEQMGRHHRVIRILVAMVMLLCCVGVLASMTETVIAIDGSSVSMHEGDYWTAWANGNHGGSRDDELVCPDGSYIREFQSFDATLTRRLELSTSKKPISNIFAVCSDKQSTQKFSSEVRNDVYSQKDQPVSCRTGFSKFVQGENTGNNYFGWTKFQNSYVSNYRAYCDTTYDDLSGNEMDGGWDGDGSCLHEPCNVMDCNGDVIAGIQTRTSATSWFNGGVPTIVNTRVLCRPKHANVKHIFLELVEKLAVKGDSAGFIEREVESEQGSQASSSVRSDTKIFVTGKVEAFEELSIEAGIKDAVESASSQDTTSMRKVIDKIHVDLSKPCYVYQAVITTTFDDGSIMVQRGETTTLSKPVYHLRKQIM